MTKLRRVFLFIKYFFTCRTCSHPLWEGDYASPCGRPLGHKGEHSRWPKNEDLMAGKKS